MIEDLRKRGLKQGLRQLTNIEIIRLLNYEGEIILDDYNYHNDQFCPLAIALDLHTAMTDPTDQKVKDYLHEQGYKIFNTRGIKGNYYTGNRLEDLLTTAHEILHERKKHRSVYPTTIEGNERIYLDPKTDEKTTHRKNLDSD